jgi:hypothetical protein
MLIQVAFVFAMQIAAARISAGVATVWQDGQLCVAMPTATLEPGTSVTLIEPGAKPPVFGVTVVRREDACAPLERAMVSGWYYVAQPVSSTPVQSGYVWLAFPGKLATRERTPGVVTLQLSPAYPNAQVRSCASIEGLHLTVWSGVPLKSKRLWHEYYYVGYDLEPSCKDQDGNDP